MTHPGTRSLVGRLERAEDVRDSYREALEDIAGRPTFERNPDGDDQAAHTMQLIARDALARNSSFSTRTEKT